MKKRKILHALIYAVLTLGALLVFFPILSYRSFFFKGYERHLQQFLRSSKAYCF